MLYRGFVIEPVCYDERIAIDGRLTGHRTVADAMNAIDRWYDLVWRAA